MLCLATSSFDELKNVAFHWISRNCNRWTDRLMDRPKCRDAGMNLKVCLNLFVAFPGSLFVKKHRFSLFFTKHHRPTNQRMGRKMDRPSYRDAGTHLIIMQLIQLALCTVSKAIIHNWEIHSLRLDESHLHIAVRVYLIFPVWDLGSKTENFPFL